MALDGAARGTYEAVKHMRGMSHGRLFSIETSVKLRHIIFKEKASVKKLQLLKFNIETSVKRVSRFWSPEASVWKPETVDIMCQADKHGNVHGESIIIE